MDYRLKNKKFDAYDLSVQIMGVADIVSGLSLQFNGCGDRMTDDSMNSALIGISRYLERLAEDVGELEVEVKE